MTCVDIGPGTTVGGRFVVEAVAGSGGMGNVYRARDDRTGTLVALKVLRGGIDGGRERFRREAEVLARMSHPHIVAHVAHDASTEGAFLAMEWIDGATLARGSSAASFRSPTR